MAHLIDEPQAKTRNHAYLRAQEVRDAMSQMANGGSASDVKSKVVEMTRASVGIDSIKASLWHLHSLGIARFELVGNKRVWSLFQSASKAKSHRNAKRGVRQ